MCYVGCGLIKARFSHHKRLHNSTCRRIHNAIKRHGPDNFAFEILEICDDTSIDFVRQREIHWIATLNTLSPNGYNLTTGGEYGYPSLETRQRQSDIQKKRVFSPEHRARISESKKGEKHHLYGKRLNPQHRAKIAQSNMGRSLSKESRTKISDTLKGHEVSNTIRAKISASLKRKQRQLKSSKYQLRFL